MNGRKRGAEFINTVVEIGTEPLFMIITVVFTVGAGILVNFFDESTIMYTICDRGFYISLSLVLVQLMLQLTGLTRTADYISENVSAQQSVVFPKDKATVDKMMQDALSSDRAKKVKIICYGTNKYGKIIEQIIDEYKNIRQLDIIVCAPDCSLFDPFENDCERIKRTLKETYNEFQEQLSKEKRGVAKRKLNIYCSSIPPTIRASVIYDDLGNPMWCTMQSYYIFLGEGTLMRGQTLSPAIIAPDVHSPILKELSANFEREYDRLLKHSSNYITYAESEEINV